MTKVNHAQYGFNAGELSPRMEMRDDVDARKLGMDSLINWMVHLQGPIETAQGVKFAGQVPGSVGKIFPFYVATFISYIVSITDEKVTVTDQEGYLDTDNQVENGDFLDGGTGWIVDTGPNASVIFVGGAAFLNPGTNANSYAEISQNITVVPTEANHLHIETVLEDGPIIVAIGTTEGADDIHPATTYVGPQLIHIEDAISSTTEMWLTIRAEGDTEGRRISQITCINETAPSHVEFDSPWTSATDIYTLQAVIAPGTLDMYITNGNIATQVLSYDKETNIWSFGPKEFTHQPDEWVAGNYPKTLAFHQGRLYLGATTLQPEAFWATRPGKNDVTDLDYGWFKYTDFRLKGNASDADVVLADHAINFTIERRGEIRWMMSSKNLVMGTENAELIITADDGVIQPSDIESTVQSTFGSAISMATLIGNDILFISPDRLKIRSMSFEWTSDQWTAQDLTFPAEHISSGGNWFRDIVYAANPHSLILCPSNDGEVISCGYNASSQRGGFYHRTTDGYIHSVCSMPFAGRDEMWILVDRSDEGGTLNLEHTLGTVNTKLDSFIEMQVTEAQTLWTGADHLAGKTCQLLADGAVHPDVVVAEDGTFSTNYAVSTVKVGLQILSTAVTMSLGTAVQYKGTARPMTKKWIKLFARITASWKPLINGKRPPTRRPSTPMGEVEPYATETVQVGNLGHDLDGRVTIVQDLPLPTEVSGIFGELSQEQL